MQLGSSAIPLLPAVAVGAAIVLVAVVLWGVHRARRNPPEVIPSVAPLRDATPLPVAEDWTGEAAAGAADPPAPPPRRTVADAVAARLADTQPLPVVDRPRAEPPPGAAVPEADGRGLDPELSSGAAVPEADGRGLDPELSPGATASEADGREPDPEPSGSIRASGPVVGVAGPTAPVTVDAPATGGSPETDAPVPVGADRSVASASAGAVRVDDGPVNVNPAATPSATGSASPRNELLPPVDGTEPSGTGPLGAGSQAGQRLPDRYPVSPSPVPPPWSDARSGPEAPEPPVPDLDVADDPPYSVPVHGPAEPVSRAVRQALAARAVQRARRRNDAVDPAPADSTLADSTLADSAPVDPARPDPVRADSALVDPARPEPTRIDPAPTGPAPTGPAPTGPAPTGPGLTGPTLTGPTLTGPTLTGPALTGSALTGSAPVDSALTGSAPVDSALTGSAPVDSALTGRTPIGPSPTRSVRSADPAERPAPDPRQTDARDRLLAVLLDDPARALGATIELDDTRARIDRIGSVLRRRRADLAVAVRRLHDSGLTGEQIERLSGLDGADVRALLDQPAGRDVNEHR